MTLIPWPANLLWLEPPRSSQLTCIWSRYRHIYFSLNYKIKSYRSQRPSRSALIQDFMNFALSNNTVRCKHRECMYFWYVASPDTAPVLRLIYDVKHVLGTRLLQKCLRHSFPGVVCTQVWNLKELTEGHHKNAWSMWLNLTQRGKSYRVRTHWGLTDICYVRLGAHSWKMLVLSWLCDRWCMAVLSSWSDLSA